MAVKVGSARMDERGKITGGKAGDQTGKEVSTQDWYRHRKGWTVLRAKDAEKREKIAEAMEKACKNANIGYDQWQRNTLLQAVKSAGYDPAKAEKKVETDCSALVRVCCLYAGITLGDVRTVNMASRMMETGAFEKLTEGKYTDKSAFLRRGDVLVTRTSGHTVVVLNDGAQADTDAKRMYAPGERVLRNGMSGEDVKSMQLGLMELGYDLGRWGADGEFGDQTEMAVERFQRDKGLEADGVYGTKTFAAMEAALGEKDEPEEAKWVRITGGNCFVRKGPSVEHEKLGVAKAGERFLYAGETTAEGWNKVQFGETDGWASGKYSRKET